MMFEWDENKRLQTINERNLDFKDAQKAWVDENSKEILIHTSDELRIVKISEFVDRKIYVVVFTIREDRIRIISFRRASKKFEEIYEKN